jgi:hypothetical protein
MYDHQTESYISRILEFHTNQVTHYFLLQGFKVLEFFPHTMYSKE